MIEIRSADSAQTPEVVAIGADRDGVRLGNLPMALLPNATRQVIESYARETRMPRAGTVLHLPQPGSRPRRVLVTGIGTGSAHDLRLAGAALARLRREAEITIAIPGLPRAAIDGLVEGLVLGSYRFSKASKPTDRVRTVHLMAGTDGFERALAYAEATVWARDLTNERSSIKTPAWVAEQAISQLEPLGVRTTVRDEHWLAENGFGGVLAVGGGSAAPPRLIEAVWRPRDAAKTPHLVLVGKGITFDTGGLNIKPLTSMRDMYSDVAGGAAVLGAVRAIATRKLPIRVTALVPAAENSVSGSAFRPSDVIRHYGGRTSEVIDTDAEGRLVLADAMAYAVRRLHPSKMVDIATLTGGMKVALGPRVGGLLATDDALADELSAAGDAVDEPLWRLPLLDDLEPLLESDVADAVNSTGHPRGITAALFLRPFAGDVPWAHLDIAGPGRAAADDGWLSRGATGFGTRLLTCWVEAQAEHV